MSMAPFVVLGPDAHVQVVVVVRELLDDLPRPEVFIHVASPTIPAAWRQYLPQAA